MQIPDPKTLEIYDLLHQSAALIPLPNRTQIEITGADRTTFLNSFCTGDIKKLQPGQGCEAFITNHQGKAVGHVFVFCEEDRLLLDGGAGQSEAIIKHLDRFVISERVEFQDRTAEWPEILLAGPQYAAFLKAIFNTSSPAERLQHFTTEFGTSRVRIRNVDFLGPIPAFQLSFFAVQSDDPLARLWSLPETEILSREIRENHPAHAAAFQIARIEAGYPLYGIDITEDNLPQEVNRNEQAISFTKGCYLGQETIARLDALGHVNRILTGLKFPADANPQPGETILQGEKKIAQITSVAYSPKLQAPLAMAYVRAIHATPGKKIPYKDGEAEVVKLPL